MRKYSPHISKFLLVLTLVFVVGGFGFPETALAECTEAQIRAGMTEDECDFHGGDRPFIPPSLPQELVDAVNPGNLLSVAVNVLLAPFAYLSIIVLQIAKLLLILSGILLNHVVLYTVVQMGANMNSDMIAKTWTTIRDVANMFFIFILLYAAIKTILGLGSDTKKLIIRVIIVAILINFSLFFTRVVIDASNVLAINFYDSIAPDSLNSEAMLEDGLSKRLTEPLKFGTLIDVKPDDIDTGPTLFEPARILIVGVLGSAFVLIASFVFFAMSLMLIIRFVVLMFVLILSPIAFMSFVLPALQNAGKQWKEALLGQAFFAPIFFLILWIDVSIIDSVLKLDGGNFNAAFNGVGASDGGVTIETNSVKVIMNFIIIIVLLIASLVISKSWADKAGSTVAGMNKWAGKFAGAIPRRIGLGAARMATYYPQRGIAALDEKFGEKKFAHTAIGSTLREATTGGLANVKIAGKTALDTKKGFETNRERRTEIANAQEAARLASELPEKYAAIEKDKTKSAEEKTKDKKKTEGEVQRAMMQLSPKSFTNMAKQNFFNKDIMRHASTGQFLALMASSRLTEDEKKEAIKARFEYMSESLDKYEDEKRIYDAKVAAWRESVIDPDNLTPEENASFGALGPAPKVSVFDDIRNKSAKEYEFLNQHDPKGLLKNGNFVSIIRSDIVAGLRSGDAFTVPEKDDLRELKYDAIIKSSDEVERLGKLPQTSENTKAMKWAEKDLAKAMTGKSAAETASMPGSRGWKKTSVKRFIDRTTLPKFAEKDQGDKAHLMKHLIDEIGLERDGKGKVTSANKKAIEWILTTKEGQNFYSTLNDDLAQAYKSITSSGDASKIEVPQSKIEVPQGYRTRNK